MSESHREAAAEKSIRMTHEPEALRVKADVEMCRKILTVLVDNAVKFSGEGGTVSINARVLPKPECDRSLLSAEAQADAWLHLSVSDTGPGIDPEDHERIFNLFEQVDGGLARHHQGAGLGLALGVSLARSQGGTIVVDSQPGSGSRFTVIIPTSTG